jgi:hypothetical protein
MPKYLVSWEESQWMNLIIDAPSKLVALDMLYDREYDVEDVAIVGQGMIPDSIECEEV